MLVLNRYLGQSVVILTSDGEMIITATQINKEPTMDRNGNHNCLEGLECPECGNHDRLKIFCLTAVFMEDMGSGDHEDLEYDDKSHCDCPDCGHGGPLSLFTIKETP